MKNRKIQVIKKNVYGNELIYPVCKESKFFTELTGRKTLTLEDIRKIKEYGYEIEFVVDKMDLNI